MVTRLLVLVAFWVTCTFGQDAPVSVKIDRHVESTPTEILGVNSYFSSYTIEYRNNSNTQIVMIKFEAGYLKRDGDPKKDGDWVYQDLTTQKELLLPQFSASFKWVPYPMLLSSGYKPERFRVRVAKVVFADGSTWQRRNYKP